MNIQKIKITNVNHTQLVKVNNAQTITMLIPIDDIPTENSQNAVSSGGVYQSLKILEEKIKNIDLSDYTTKKELEEALKNVEVDLTDYYTKDEINKTLDEKVETSFDEKLGDIDLILDEIINGALEVDNKEY